MPVLVQGARGTYVELVQSILKRLGFYNGEIDGIFGPNTLNAVITFQREFGLVPDGIVGRLTWKKLLLYVNGTVGEIVPTDVSYPYWLLRMNIRDLKNKYPFIIVGNYGQSVMGKALPYIQLGRGNKQVFYSASIHANEWINSVVLMKFVESYAIAYEQDGELFGYNIRDLYNDVSIFIAPMVNPDGVDLVLGEINRSSSLYKYAQTISNNYPDIPFPAGWKANLLGIDLNLQFPAEWERAREIKYAQGFTSPAPRDFVGYGPLTEPESLALYNFTLTHNFRLTISYHTQGEIIFWRFLDYEPEGAEEVANEFARVSGYELIDTGFTDSYAGYRDWFISFYNRPGYTIETGKGTNPIPISQFAKIYSDNIGILVLGAVVV